MRNVVRRKRQLPVPYQASRSPLTRRGVLSIVGPIYDPNGYLAPVTIKGKQILQQMCQDKLDCDSPVPDYLRPEWEKW